MVSYTSDLANLPIYLGEDEIKVKLETSIDTVEGETDSMVA